MRIFLVPAIVLSFAAPASAFSLIISGDGEGSDLSSVTIFDRDSGNEDPAIEENGDYRFFPDREWMNNRGIVETDIIPERDDQDLKIEALFRTCSSSHPCEEVVLSVPSIPKTFGFREVMKRCSVQTPSNTFKTRLKKYYYCRAAYRWMKSTNLADAENWPASSFALWSWFSTAYQLYTNHKSRNVPYISWDQEAEAEMASMLASEDAAIFLKTIAVSQSDIEKSLDNARLAFMARLGYARELVSDGWKEAAAQIVARVSDEYQSKRSRYPASLFAQNDVRFMNTLRVELAVGDPLK